jgi:UDP-N-acetylmuramoyl-L-alanyl-D-glutamate--2,6-diaminopimelate ligase
VALHHSSTAESIVRQLDALGVARKLITVDSRSVSVGDVFAAVPGSAVDGRDFVSVALAKGAAAVLRDVPCINPKLDDPRVIDVENLPLHLGEIADAFYEHPSLAMQVIGVTGTNGKTSVASWLAQAYTALGIPCGAVGTLGVSLGAQTWSTNNTTPDAALVHSILRDLQRSGAAAVAIEVSSHALALYRVNGVRFEAVVFTNLTQDHLDFHGTMAEYGAAKTMLFTDYPTQHRIINADDELGAQLIAKALPNTLSYGMQSGDVRASLVSAEAGGMKLTISFLGQSIGVETALIGRFNIYNMLAVAATLVASGMTLEKIGPALCTLTAAPGRMQRVNADLLVPEPSVYVDYAHTPDALAKALDTVRETCPRALTVVFGCGGDRDRSKRAQMGRIAVDRADRVFVTSDNPRSELPQTIINEIVAGIEVQPRTELRTFVLRREAIALAISEANVNDAILIAGKGHENYQEIQGVRHPFSDVQEAQAALVTRANKMALPTGVRHVG